MRMLNPWLMNHWPRLAGILMQGTVLGVLLFVAVLVLLAFDGSVRLFRYQGF
jgi:hypothetical protein